MCAYDTHPDHANEVQINGPAIRNAGVGALMVGAVARP